MNNSSDPQPLESTSPFANDFKAIVALLSKIAESVPSGIAVQKYLTVEDAAAYCRLAVQTIYNNRKHIARMPGVRKLLFTREALDNWLASRPSRRRKRK